MRQMSRRRTAATKATAESARGREVVAILARHHLERGITPEKLRLILEDLGPTFVKLGQILSMRTDLLPVSYCQELEKLRAQARPMPMEEVRQVICQATGKAVEEAFAAFVEEPIGSASIAQVHRATLRDGRDAVVKVQRPGIRQTMASDLALVRKAAGVTRLTGLDRSVDFAQVLDEMEAMVQEETDFRREADNLRAFAQANADVACVACPQVYGEWCGETLLCMEYVEGISLRDRQALADAGYDLDDIGGKLAENYVKQIVDDGFFHADPHPGNIRIRGGQIVWLDMGMMGRLTERDRELLRKAVAAVAAHDAEALRRIVMAMGRVTGPVDSMTLTGDIDDFLTRYEAVSLGSLDLGGMLRELMELSQKHHIAVPSGMTMLARGAVTIEGVLREVSPQTSIMAVVTRHMANAMLADIHWKEEAASFLGDARDSMRKAARLPGQLSDTLRTVNRGQARLNVELRAREGVGINDRMMRRAIYAMLSAACVLAGAVASLGGVQPGWLGLGWLSWLLLAAGALLGLAALLDGRRGKR